MERCWFRQTGNTGSMDRKWTYLEKLDCIVDLHYLLIRKRGGTNRNVTYIFIHTTALDTQKNESSSSIKSWRHVSTTLSCVCFSFIYHGDVTHCSLMFYTCNSTQTLCRYIYVLLFNVELIQHALFDTQKYHFITRDCSSQVKNMNQITCKCISNINIPSRVYVSRTRKCSKFRKRAMAF